MQQKRVPSSSRGQNLKPRGQQGHAPSAGSGGQFFLHAAPDGSGIAWLMATSLWSLPLTSGGHLASVSQISPPNHPVLSCKNTCRWIESPP